MVVCSTDLDDAKSILSGYTNEIRIDPFCEFICDEAFAMFRGKDHVQMVEKEGMTHVRAIIRCCKREFQPSADADWIISGTQTHD